MAWDVSTDPDDYPDAVAWFASKRPVTRDEWDKLTIKERRRAFVVSGVAKIDTVKHVQDALAKAIKNGQSLDEFKKSVIPSLRSAWGGDVNHPGKVSNPGWRIETIFRTNLQHAYTAGRWLEMTRPEVLAVRPYWMFDSILDSRTTPQCQSLDGTVLEACDPFWETHAPPLHFCCRSQIRSLREAKAKKQPKFGRPAPAGIDAQDGFGISPFDVPSKPKSPAGTPTPHTLGGASDAPTVGTPSKGVKPFKVSEWRETDRGLVPKKPDTYDTPPGLLDGIWGRDDIDPENPEHKARLDSIRKAYDDGKEGELPPIRIFYTKDGNLEIEDGNHRLMVAMERHAPSIPVVWQKNDHAGGGYLKRWSVEGPKGVVYEWRPDVSQYPPELQEKVREVIEKAKTAGSLSRNPALAVPPQGPPPSPAKASPRPFNAIPSGEPVSMAFDVGGGRAIQQIKAGLEAIDAVHGDGKLQSLALKQVGGKVSMGGFSYDEKSRKPKNVTVNSGGDCPTWSTVHEAGHFQDHQVLGAPGWFASRNPPDNLKKLMRLIELSLAISALQTIASKDSVLLPLQGGKRGRYPIDTKYVKYLLLPEECYARAYAQYIAIRSGNKDMLKYLALLRVRGHGVYYARQWEDEEFEPIAAAFDALFEELEWIKRTTEATSSTS